VTDTLTELDVASQPLLSKVVSRMFARLTQALVRAFQVAISALRVQSARFEVAKFRHALMVSFETLFSNTIKYTKVRSACGIACALLSTKKSFSPL
jgi:hypothetical protein